MRRSKDRVDDRHFLAAIRGAPNDPRGHERYARWLKGRNRALEAEAAGVRARHCERIDFDFSWSRLEEVVEGRVSTLSGGSVVCLTVGCWELWADAGEVQDWLRTATTEDIDIDKFPGELDVAGNELCRRLWDEAVPLDSGPGDVRRVAGEREWFVWYYDDPLGAETFGLEKHPKPERQE